MKTEVYSWRVSAAVKMGLEREARRRKLSLSAVLDLAAREWLTRSGNEDDVDQEQLRLHHAASQCFGIVASNEPHRSENARAALRKLLRPKNAR